MNQGAGEALHKIATASVVAVMAMTGICLAQRAYAQGYPSHTIRFVVPSAAGGGPDTVARLLATVLTDQLKQQVIVDNRPGGAFTIGIKAVAGADPDGYTIGYGSVGPLAISPALLPSIPYDPDKDLQAIAQVGMSQCILAVNLSLPVKSVKELIAYAKSNPGKLSYGASNGSIDHVAADLFNMMAGTRIIHVPYKSGAQSVSEVIGGQIQLIFANLPEIWSQVGAGKVRALAVTGPKRSPGFPDLPTVSEAGVPGYDAISWGGVIAPAGVPKPVVQKLNAEINRAIATPLFQKRYRDIGNEPTGGTPEQFARFVREQRMKWSKVVKHIGATVD